MLRDSLHQTMSKWLGSGRRTRKISCRQAVKTRLWFEQLEDRLTPSLSPVGGDITTYPYRAVVELQITWPNGDPGSGTGAMVDSYHVLTAAHCIYDFAEGGWAKTIIATPAFNDNSAPYGQATAIYAHVTSNWIQDSNDGNTNSYTDSDVGLITLNCMIGKATGWFQLLPEPDGQINYDMSVSMAGYPGLNGNQISFQNPASLGNTMYGESGTITTVSPDPDGEEFVYPFQDLEYTYGMSGAPLWVDNNGVPSIVGVHVTGGANPSITTIDPNGFGYATRISEFIYLWVQGMEDIDDAFLLPYVAPGPSSALLSADATEDALSGVSAMTSAGPAPSDPYLEAEESPWATTTTLSATALSFEIGQPVQFTAVVASSVPVASSASAVTPTGTVTFYDGTTTLGTGTLVTNASGVTAASLTTRGLPAGDDMVTDVYSGDSNDLGSDSTALATTVASSLELGSLGITEWPVNQPGYSSTIPLSFGTGPYSNLQINGLPAGLAASLSGNNILIAGTPTQAGTFSNLTVSLEDSTGASASATYTLTIDAPSIPNIVVTTTSDATGHSGESLRDAVTQADSDAAGGQSVSIGFAASLVGQTITLTQGQLELKGPGTITFDGAGQISISGNNAGLVFQVDGGANVVLSGLNINGGGIQNGSAFQETGGNLSLRYCTVSNSGIYSNGTLTVTNCVISGNSSANGAAIWNDGTATLTNCAVFGNTAQFEGGGIANLGDTGIAHLTMANCTVSGNSAGTSGGGIENGGIATLTSCTISGNSAGSGGGIDDNGGTLTLIDCTVSDNSATDSTKGAGGVSISDDYATVTVLESTIAGNSTLGKGGGIYNGYPNELTGTPSTLTLQNTIVAGNYAASAPDVDTNPSSGATITANYSLIGDTTNSAINSGNGNVLNPTSLELSGLGNFGGPTQTVALLAGSPALAAGNAAATDLPATDQRGFARVVNGKIDMGAFQIQSPVAFTSAAATTFTVGSSGAFTVSATGFPSPYVSESSSDSLPSGVTFNASTGVLGGTPAAGTAGAYTLHFTASNGVGTPATQTFTLTVNQPLPATISGTVFQDINLNGVQGPGEQGIAGVTVFLDLNDNGVLDPGDPTATTNASGAYSFMGLAPGTYNVRQVVMGGVILSTPSTGSYSLTVTSGSAFTDQNFADVLTSIAIPLTLPPNTAFTAEGNANADYVEAIYRAVLDRNADPGGLSSWSTFLNNGGTRLLVVQGIWDSPEHFNQEVTAFYLTLLRRAPDAAGLTYWVGQLQNGVPEEQIASAFLNTKESLSKGDKYFVDEMYESLLGRSFDPTGEAYWLNALGDDASGDPTHAATLTHAQVVPDFLYSTESLDRLVAGYYEVFLRRQADPGGLEGWVPLLQPGPFRSIAEAIFASDEFYNNAAKEG